MMMHSNTLCLNRTTDLGALIPIGHRRDRFERRDDPHLRRATFMQTDTAFGKDGIYGDRRANVDPK